MKIDLVRGNSNKFLIEALRAEVFKLEGNSTFYIDSLLIDDIRAIAMTDKDKMVGGCYFRRFEESLILDQVFVDEAYKDKKIEEKLVGNLILNKEYFEEELNGKINAIRIEPIDEKERSVFIKMGFRDSVFSNGQLVKRINK